MGGVSSTDDDRGLDADDRGLDADAGAEDSDSSSPRDDDNGLSTSASRITFVRLASAGQPSSSRTVDLEGRGWAADAEAGPQSRPQLTWV